MLGSDVRREGALAMEGDIHGPDGAQRDAEVVSGTVKWFNKLKGFGFIALPDDTGDVFVHHSTLKAAGYDAIDQGTTVVCEAVRGPKGMQALRIVEIDVSTAVPSEGRPPPPRGPRHGRVVAEGPFMGATVKWFNADKGYGFVQCGEDDRDIFVHIKTLRRVGIEMLRPGQEVRIRVGQGPKGPQVAEIEAE